MAFDKDEDFSFFRVQPTNVKGPSSAITASKHNLRELYAEIGYVEGGKIDGRRSHLNVVLAGATTAAGVCNDFDALMDREKVVIKRVDNVRICEAVASLFAGTAVDVVRYFTDALPWVADFYQVKVVSAVIHMDQANPHCHYLFAPIIRDKLGVNMLSADRVLGKKSKIRAAQASFFENVAAKHGVLRPKPAKTLTAETKRKYSELIADCLDCPALDDDPKRMPALIRALRLSPGLPDLIESFGFTLPAGGRTFTEIMTAPCNPEASTSTPNRDRARALTNPYIGVGVGIETLAMPDSAESTVNPYPVLGVAFAPTSICPPAPAFSLPPIVLLADSPPALDSKESEKTHTARIEDAGALEPKAKARAFDSALDSGVKEKIGDSAGDEADNDGFDCEAVPPVPDTPLRKPRGHAPTEADIALAWRMKKSGAHMSEISEIVGCKKSTLYKVMPHPAKTLAAENQPGLWH